MMSHIICQEVNKGKQAEGRLGLRLRGSDALFLFGANVSESASQAV